MRILGARRGVGGMLADHHRATKVDGPVARGLPLSAVAAHPFAAADPGESSMAMLRSAAPLVAALLLAPAATAATVVVTALGDSAGACPGPTCTLRAALAAAAAGDEIVFDPALALPATIMLLNDELTVAADLTVTGPGADRLTVQAAAGRRVARITAGVVEVSGLTLAGGRLVIASGLSGPPGSGQHGQPGGAAEGGCLRIDAGAHLSLRDSAVQDCQALAGNGGNGGRGVANTNLGNSGGAGGNGAFGGVAAGGAIAVFGELQLIGSSVADALARGGRGGDGGDGGNGNTGGGNGGFGGPGGAARGGAVFVAGSGALLLRNSTLTGNALEAGRGGDGGDGGDALVDGNGGNGAVGGLAEGGALFVSSGASVAAEVEFATLGPSAVAAGPGGFGGTGNANGGHGLGGEARGEALASATAATRLRHSVATGTGTASDCHGDYLASGSNFGGDGGCAGFTHSGAHGANFVAGSGGGRQLLRPRPGSLAIDAAGDCNDLAGAAVAGDQLGQPRPIDGDGNGSPLCDLGAIEYTPRIFRDGFEG
jgi:hypothetical protein